MAKTYINTTMRVTRMEPDDIIVTSVGANGLSGFGGYGGSTGGVSADAPERSIWNK